VGAAGTALPLPLLVHVTDQYGAGFAGATVTFTTSNGATTAAPTATTDANGDASMTVTLGALVGIDSITAAVAGAAVPARFAETAIAGPVATDSIASGNLQTGTTGTVLPVGLSVVVLDSHGNRVAGDTVTWAAVSGTLNLTTTVTDATGTASVQFTPALGANSVTASIGGSALVASFTETGN
jgi:adhesin/invasin